MPFVSAKVGGVALDVTVVGALQRGFTDLMAEVLGKRADLTAVLIEAAEAGRWSVGGTAVGVAAHVEATITLGTNNAAEKARFVAQAQALLVRVLPGPLPPATYVVVREVPGESWGYGGLTQAHRAAAA